MWQAERNVFCKRQKTKNRRKENERSQVFEDHRNLDDRFRCDLHSCGRVRRRAWRVGGRTRRSIWPDLLLLAALFLTLVGGICQLIAGVKGVKHCQRIEEAGKLIIWGAIVAVFCILSTVLSMVNGGEYNFMSILTGVAVPALYIYGAVLNSKTEDEFAA